MSGFDELDALIDRHAVADPARVVAPFRAVPQFRPFTPADWAAYHGCETENPQIAQRNRFEVILDGCDVGATLFTDEEGHGAVFIRTLQDEAVAAAIGRSLLACSNPDLEFVSAILGEPVGEI